MYYVVFCLYFINIFFPAWAGYTPRGSVNYITTSSTSITHSSQKFVARKSFVNYTASAEELEDCKNVSEIVGFYNLNGSSIDIYVSELITLTLDKKNSDKSDIKEACRVLKEVESDVNWLRFPKSTKTPTIQKALGICKNKIKTAKSYYCR
jgi:hypothetical protein